MKILRFLFLLTGFGLFLEGSVPAQGTRSFNPLTDDITTLVPPLVTLLDSAYLHDPGLKFSELQTIVDKCNLHSAKAQWAQDIGFQANAGYGTFDYLYNNTIAGQNQTTTLRQNETQYGVGGFIRLPFYDLVNRRNQLKLARTVVEQAQTLSETRRNEIREMVLKQYNDMIAKQRVLKIKSKYLETSRINTQMAEKGFVKGAVSVDDYARVSEIGTRTESDFETSRMDFITSYMLLEVMTGMNFNLSNETPQKNEGN